MGEQLHPGREPTEVGSARLILALGAALGLGILSVPQISPTALDLVDGGWVLANSLAGVEGLAWGRDLAYSYGPLGFLRSPLPLAAGLVPSGALFWVATAAAAILAGVALQRRGVAAWLVAFAAVSLAGLTSDLAIPLVAVVLVALAFHWRRPTKGTVGAFLGLGLAAGALLLVKFNVGVTSGAVLCVLAVLGPRRWRHLGAVVLGSAGGLLAGWLVTGSPVLALPQFLIDSVDISLGYSHAQSNGSRTAGGQLAYAVGGALLLALVGGGWAASRGLPRTSRLGTALALVVLGLGSWAQGFTRFDPGHVTIFFAVVGPVTVILFAACRHWGWWRWAAVGPAYLAAAGSMLVLLGSPGGGAPVNPRPVTDLVHPRVSLARVTDAVRLTVDPDAREARLDGLAAGFLAEAALPQSVSSRLPGLQGQAEPQAVGALWAAGATWRPVPVYQTHMAYTSRLDARNVAAVAGPRGDSVAGVLREDVGVDSTNPLWQSPGLQLQWVCRYRQTVAEGRWALLQRAGDRCGEPTELGAVTVSAGTEVAVPDGPGVIVAEVLPQTRTRGRVEVGCDSATYPLMQPLPTGPLIMRLPPEAGWSTLVHPLSCQVVRFSVPVEVRWSAVPLR